MAWSRRGWGQASAASSESSSGLQDGSRDVLTLHAVAVDPSVATWPVRNRGAPDLTLRPLEASDLQELRDFLLGLGPITRHFYDVTDPADHAAEMCEAIDRFDKLRLVLTEGRTTIVGLIELSFGLPPGDHIRFAAYDLELRPGLDVRWGICLAEALQGRGVAQALWPHVVTVAKSFGCTRVLLWGGVYASNERARTFYGRIGFTEVGRFRRGSVECVDMVAELP